MKMKDLKTSDITLEQLDNTIMKKGWALSFIGTIVCFFLGLFEVMPKSYYGIPYFEIGKKRWGGVCLGFFFITNKDSSDATKNHEVGHMVQNAVIGGLPMIWYSIGSFVRWWKRKIFGAKTPYDSWWFEGNATALGDEFIARVKGEE